MSQELPPEMLARADSEMSTLDTQLDLVVQAAEVILAAKPEYSHTERVALLYGSYASVGREFDKSTLELLVFVAADRLATAKAAGRL